MRRKELTPLQKLCGRWYAEIEYIANQSEYPHMNPLVYTLETKLKELQEAMKEQGLLISGFK